jgi:hypothetical protein
MRNYIVLVVLSGILGLAAPQPAVCVEQEGLGFLMTSAKTVYQVGERIHVTFTWTNLTDRRLVIVNWRGPTGGVTDYSQGTDKRYDFSVYYDGKEMLAYHGEFACGPLQGLTLEPKATVTRTYEISEVYSFSRPGRYLLRTIYAGYALDDPVPEHWRGKIIHPDVEIWIHE